jgi:hypothetical protein
MCLKSTLRHSAIILFLIVANVQVCRSAELYLAAHGEPSGSQTFVLGPSEQWTFAQDGFSVGLELGQPFAQDSYVYAGSRLELNTNNSGYVAGTGVVFDAGIVLMRNMMTLKYQSMVYWDKSGEYGFGQTCYTQPAHRIQVDIRYPLLGRPLP